MKERPRRGHPSFAPLFLARCVIALLVATFLAGCGGGGSGDSRSSSKAQAQVNVVMRNNAPGVQTQGRFEAVPGYLSQSPLVLRSVDHDVASATFHLGVPQRGFYRLYAWWPQAVPAAGIAQVIVQHQGGETASTVDQRTLGGQWNALGEFELDPAGPATIVFRQAGTATLLIDAVRFQFVGAQRPALTIATQALPISPSKTATMPRRWT